MQLIGKIVFLAAQISDVIAIETLLRWKTLRKKLLH